MAGLGAFILGCAGTRLSDDERRFFARAQPFGFILFSRNLRDPDQIRALTQEMRAAVGRDAPVLIDQEGGRVTRLGAPHWSVFPPALDHVARLGPRRAAAGMRLRAQIVAAELRTTGIDVNCVPLADIASPDTHAVLRNRCYGSDPGSVAGIAAAVARGCCEGGVAPVLKHMPGHGRATSDSHLDLPVVRADAETLRGQDFAPFRALAQTRAAAMGMTAHIVYTAFDAGRPATASAVMIRLIREELGFGGLLMTDDISMQALSGDVAARAARAREAGCDVVLHCNGEMAEMAVLAEAAGRLSGDALERGRAALEARPVAPDPGVAAAARGALAALEQEAADDR